MSKNPSNSLRDKLEGLFERHPNIPIQYMGIPSDGKGKLLNWQNEPIWK